MTDLKAILQKYSAGAVRGSGLSTKNGYRKQKEARADMNEVLRQNGFKWVKSENLDIAQGETGEFSWTLEDSQGEEWKPLKALCFIYSQDIAWLIPRSGGKLKEISPNNSYNIIKAVIYQAMFGTILWV